MLVEVCISSLDMTEYVLGPSAFETVDGRVGRYLPRLEVTRYLVWIEWFKTYLSPCPELPVEGQAMSLVVQSPSGGLMNLGQLPLRQIFMN